MTSVTPRARLAAIGLVVEDMAASLAFYRRLGVDVPEEADAEGHVDVVVPGGLRLMWDTREVVAGFDPSWTPAAGGHRVALAFDCGSPAGVDDTYTALTAGDAEAGHLPPFTAPWGQRYAVVHDPDGNAVDLFAELPL